MLHHNDVIAGFCGRGQELCQNTLYCKEYLVSLSFVKSVNESMYYILVVVELVLQLIQNSQLKSYHLILNFIDCLPGEKYIS